MDSPIEMDSPQSSPTGRAESCSPTGLPTMTAGGINGSIFPSLPTREELFSRLRERAGNGGGGGSNSHSPTPLPASGDVASNGQWLANWLANNPFGSPALSGLAGMQQQLIRNSLLNKNCPLEDDGLEINCVDDTVTDESLLNDSKDDDAVKVEPTSDSQAFSVQRSSIVGNPLNSLLYKKKLNNALRNKRKASAPRPLSSFLKAEREESGEAPPAAKIPTVAKQENASEQPSPTASDSHTSGSNGPLSANGSDASGSPHKCFECQVRRVTFGPLFRVHFARLAQRFASLLATFFDYLYYCYRELVSSFPWHGFGFRNNFGVDCTIL